ncbi:MAG TPA: pyridoxamine 5'-phosphate oxidase family protein [Streptosporangiaceae bacterium]|nr:pyridoxamine 5'-phosphate oxidase family protein [Streptosporangiaceae bacterium]
MNVDSGLEMLSPEECISLAATMPIGRIVFTDRALPAVQPVNFLIEDGSVIIRTTQGSKLATATRNAIVAFEIDEFDRRSQAGWSVTMIGRAQSVHDPAESARLARLPLHTWASGPQDRFIRIRPEQISGRRLPASARCTGHHPQHPANGHLNGATRQQSNGATGH